MSLFPAYSAGEEAAPTGGDQQQRAGDGGVGGGGRRDRDPGERDWLQMASFGKAQAAAAAKESSRSVPPSRSRSRSPKKRRKRSRSRSRDRSRRRKRSRSKSRKRTRSRSRSRKREKHRGDRRDKKRRSRSRSRDSRGGRDKKDKDKKLTDEEMVVQYSKGKTFLEDLGGLVRPEMAFKEDRTANAKLTKASSLPPFSVAKYKTRWSRSVLGGSGTLRKRDKEQPLRFYAKSYGRAFLRAQGVEKILVSGKNLPVEEGENKIALEDKAPPREVEGAEGDDSGEEEVGEGQSFKLHYVQERTKEYNERLRQNPEDEDLWLEFVDFQDESLQSTEFSGKEEEKETKKQKAAKNVVMKRNAVVEKKLAILKAALDKNPSSIRLAVRRLELSREVLETPVLDRQWKELIFLFPKNFELWRYYLRFASSYFTSFSVSKVLKVYRTCFSKLRQVQAQSFLAADRPEDLEHQMRFILVGLCHFLARAGFREKGVALFQAMMELNLFSPEFPGYYSLDDRLALFEPFWESGAPRFGEPGVAGWKTVMKDKQASAAAAEDFMEQMASREEDLLQLQKTGQLVDKNVLWLELELERERRHWLPWRSSEEEAEDPDRAVPFEDLSPFVFQFNDPKEVFLLLVNFVHFLGVTYEDERFFPTSIASETVASTFVGSDSANHILSDVSFQPDIIAPILQSTSPSFIEDSVFQTFVRNIFSQSSNVLKGGFKTAAVCLWLRFELRVFEETSYDTVWLRKKRAKEVRAVAKGLLQNDQKNIDIYLEYARLQHKMEGFKEAWKILQSTMVSLEGKVNIGVYLNAACVILQEMSRSSDLSLTEELIWMFTLIGLRRGYSSREENRPVMLDLAAQAKDKAESFLRGQVESNRFVMPGEEERLVENPVTFVPTLVSQAYVCCWLDFFTNASAENAVSTVTLVLQKIGELQKKSPVTRLIVENLQKLRLDLLVFASERDKLLAKNCRQVLKASLASCPASHYFLQHLCTLDVQPSAVDATWRAFVNATTSSGGTFKSPIPEFYAIKLLLKHFVACQKTDEDDSVVNESVAAVTYLHRSQALLERFVAREPGRFSILIWRLLLWVTAMLDKMKGDVKVINPR